MPRADVDARCEFCRYAVASALDPEQAPTASRVRRADVSLEVRRPCGVRINFGGHVHRPYNMPEHYRGIHENEAEYRASTQKWRSQVAPVLEDLSKWEIEPPRPEPEVVVEMRPDTWHFIIAPLSEGLMASFQRLQLVRSWADGLPAQNFGVVTDNRTLARMALDQGYKAYVKDGSGQE